MHNDFRVKVLGTNIYMVFLIDLHLIWPKSGKICFQKSIRESLESYYTC